MIIIFVLALVDIHTLFVLLFHEHLPAIYVFSGSSFAILKGLIFFIPTKEIFSFLDIVVGVLMLFLLLGGLWSIIWWAIFLYLSYKIIMSLSILK